MFIDASIYSLLTEKLTLKIKIFQKKILHFSRKLKKHFEFLFTFYKKKACRVINLKGADMIARNKTLIVSKSTFKHTLSSPHVLIVNK